jgi:hypothetical protein
MIESVLQHLDKQDQSVAPVTCVAITNVTTHWPYEDIEKENTSRHCPDIVICTPALIASFIKGPALLKPKLFQSTRVVVLDEVILPTSCVFLRPVVASVGVMSLSLFLHHTRYVHFALCIPLMIFLNKDPIKAKNGMLMY